MHRYFSFEAMVVPCDNGPQAGVHLEDVCPKRPAAQEASEQLPS